MVIANPNCGGQETMRFNGIKRLGGAILGLFLFAGIMAVSSTTAQAQYPTWNQDQYRRAERERRERERELQRQRERQTQSGYYDQYGNWHSTGTYNNNGYYNTNGYYNNGSRRWDGYGNQGGSYELRQTALNSGYNEGLKDGRDARRRGGYSRSRNVNSLKDYNSRMGDRYTYQQYFMQAYQNGYADGLRGV
jgi:hypothetical protein